MFALYRWVIYNCCSFRSIDTFMYPVLEWTVYLIRPYKQLSYLTAEKRVNSVVSLCIHVLCIHVLCSHVLCIHVLFIHVLCIHVLFVHVLCIHVLCIHVLCIARTKFDIYDYISKLPIVNQKE